MRRFADCVFILALLITPSITSAQSLGVRWGLKNTWSYYEERRDLNENASYRQKGGPSFRAFAFNDRKEILDLMSQCSDRHFKLWDEYRLTKSLKPTRPSGQDRVFDEEREAFETFKSVKDPYCLQHFKKQAPVLYFDFSASESNTTFVLEAIEVTTLGFSEYRGGGFAQKEAWYDIVLSHKLGRKRYDVAKRLTFNGTAQCDLRLWSDNYYPTNGWIAPMGEYRIDLRFIFRAGDKSVSVSTGPFKVDV